MSTDAAVRALVTRWVDAVRDKDLGGVLAQHSDDIAMFDVPPPHQGVRGIAAYRDSWAPFFDWQRSTDGIFDLVELTVEAGSEVAFRSPSVFAMSTGSGSWGTSTTRSP